ncbi:deoxyribose-phosphate aldolase [Aquimarina brevivitae]|uniref:Deoxyribose-phosphate aldolase n=1 Tax=Aquimarina brevivitae TaxID=323412 RepID=A0A4Q7PGP0_9FLAO|nr:deoxyribose-phosphate aldolase [Aquimarina brevivitae]RZS99676.1 deoxyribose-phosphate aldolase [Aquimarina brevivitae]
MEFGKFIDHTLLKPNATVDDIKNLCDEAKQYNFYSVCVNSYYAALADSQLRNTDIKVCAVVGFPFGAQKASVKAFEAKQCAQDCADEIDMVLNVGMLKSGYYDLIEEEIRMVKNAIEERTLKVIFENCYLTDEQKKIACNLSIKAGADFIKTSTGFGTGGATLADVELMKKEVGDRIKIKASGGIRDRETAVAFIRAGAERIGTSSGIKILSE